MLGFAGIDRHSKRQESGRRKIGHAMMEKICMSTRATKFTVALAMALAAPHALANPVQSSPAQATPAPAAPATPLDYRARLPQDEVIY
ncbi:MAG: hypothetical protein EOO77_15310, partial [Oxalobacteraceae bacterium]